MQQLDLTKWETELNYPRHHYSSLQGETMGLVKAYETASIIELYSTSSNLDRTNLISK